MQFEYSAKELKKERSEATKLTQTSKEYFIPSRKVEVVNPNEKSLHLIELFWCEVEDLSLKEVKMSKNQAIQCALICVEELINVTIDDELKRPRIPRDRQYWQSVKQELLNLK